MANPVTYFEILGNDGKLLAGFYRDLFGWEVTPVEEGGAYSSVDTGDGLGGGITEAALFADPEGHVVGIMRRT